MRTLSTEDRRSYLLTIQKLGDAGRAEGASPDALALGFYPVVDHLRMLDPEVVLVVGPRGSGKTEIANILTVAAQFEALKRYTPAIRLPSGKAQWIRAYPMDREGFDPIGFRAFWTKLKNDSRALQEIWFAYLLRVLRPHYGPQAASRLDPLLRASPTDLSAIHKAFKKLGTDVVATLDELDARLERDDVYLFVTYDELDGLGRAGSEWPQVDAGVGGLMSFWATYARRWKRVRAKLFVRTDLYERNLRSGEADLAKLASGRVELTWADRDLYGLLLKGLCNGTKELSAYIASIRGPQWQEDADLGLVPKLSTSQDARPVVERLFGVYMGANAKKGLVFRWLLDHVRDGRGRAYPRPFVRLIEEAARRELMDMGASSGQKLLSPASIRRALDAVSKEHVTQSYSEWPWLRSIVDGLAGDPLVPYAEKEIIELLKRHSEKADSSPPFEGRDLLEYLLELGILRRRPEGRIDVPDLFLAGLGLRRKGGVVKR